MTHELDSPVPPLRGSVIGGTLCMVAARWGVRFVLLFIVAPLADVYFKEPRVANLARVFGVAVVVRSLANVGVVAFREELRFHKEFQLTVAGKLFSFAATVGLAIILYVKRSVRRHAADGAV